jgi:Ankyrin repeats (3 copies)
MNTPKPADDPINYQEKICGRTLLMMVLKTTDSGCVYPREVQTAYVKALLAAGADPDILNQDGDFGGTAAHYAAQTGNPEALDLILTGGNPDTDPEIIKKRANTVDMHGGTPLFHGAFPHPEVVRLLLERGADLAITTRRIDRSEINALVAAQEGFQTYGAKGYWGCHPDSIVLLERAMERNAGTASNRAVVGATVESVALTASRRTLGTLRPQDWVEQP